jgi:PPOX class probable F420-dependent enzyme
MMSDSLAPLRGARYLAVTTFRADGSPVTTPVWFALDGEAIVIWTDAESGKARRLRRDPRAELAPCTITGRPTGPPLRARAELLPPGHAARIQRLLDGKYGLEKRLWLAATRAGRLLRGRTAVHSADLYIAFTPESGSADGGAGPAETDSGSATAQPDCAPPAGPPGTGQRARREPG